MSISPRMPKHIAIIMDGNGRWAKKKFLPRQMGHRAGAKTVQLLLDQCIKHGIQVLTLFTFSSENWQRPQQEIDALLSLLLENLQKKLSLLQEHGIRLRVIGERERFDTALQAEIATVEQATQKNTRLQLVLAVSYSGRWDICQAVKRLVAQMQTNNLTTDDISPELIAKNLTAADLPDPDLLIRTSGEQRLSNFLLWQLAYTELYFTDSLWPDFDEQEFKRALHAYAQRDRRFGLTIAEAAC